MGKLKEIVHKGKVRFRRAFGIHYKGHNYTKIENAHINKNAQKGIAKKAAPTKLHIEELKQYSDLKYLAEGAGKTQPIRGDFSKLDNSINSLYQKSKREAEKIIAYPIIENFGRNLGFGAKRYITKGGKNGRYHLAKDIIENQDKGSEKIVDNARYVFNYHAEYIKETIDTRANEFEKKILNVNKRTQLPFSKEFHKRFIESAIRYNLKDKDIKKIGKKFEKRTRVRVNQLEQFSREYIETQEGYALEELERLIKRTVGEQVEDRNKLGRARFDGVDLGYSIGKGKDVIAYVELMDRLKESEATIFHPNNLYALRKSEKFKESFFKEMTPVGGKKRAQSYYKRAIKQGEATYILTDTSRGRQTQKIQKKWSRSTFKDDDIITKSSEVKAKSKKYKKKKKRKKK